MAMRLMTLGTSRRGISEGIGGNTIYAVDDDGLLRWYKYLGAGQRTLAPGNNFWHPNSGNSIGGGWDLYSWIKLGNAGTLFAVTPAGELHWYRYDGDGEDDSTGVLGWAPGSGKKVADGLQRFVHLMVLLDDISGFWILLGVDADGTMSAYVDQPGGVGLLPGSPKVVSHGWTGFSRLIATTATIFGVTDSGDLNWYQFTYPNTIWPEPAGSDWALMPNSGNKIGSGFNGFRLLDVGGIEFPPRGTPTFAGIADGSVYWYEYRGAGAPNVDDSHWSPYSGNIVSASW